jgi:hypothetical protein
VDFWAQHKDFILKVLAGVGVFLVALLARSITYGGDLDKEKTKNQTLARQIRATEVASQAQIQGLARAANDLHENAATIARQVGFDLKDPEHLKQILLDRALRCTRTYARDEDARRRMVDDFRGALSDELNSGFGQLRLTLRQALVEEANQNGIKVEEGIGFGNLNEIGSDQLIQYLLQLELVARFLRSAIDARVDKIEDIRITSGTREAPVIPNANPGLLCEYEVTVIFSAAQPAALKILDDLERDAPRVPLRAFKATRLKRPVDHLSIEMTMLAVASNPDPKVHFVMK